MQKRGDIFHKSTKGGVTNFVIAIMVQNGDRNKITEDFVDDYRIFSEIC